MDSGNISTRSIMIIIFRFWNFHLLQLVLANEAAQRLLPISLFTLGYFKSKSILRLRVVILSHMTFQFGKRRIIITKRGVKNDQSNLENSCSFIFQQGNPNSEKIQNDIYIVLNSSTLVSNQNSTFCFPSSPVWCARIWRKLSQMSLGQQPDDGCM